MWSTLHFFHIPSRYSKRPNDLFISQQQQEPKISSLNLHIIWFCICCVFAGTQHDNICHYYKQTCSYSGWLRLITCFTFWQSFMKYINDGKARMKLVSFFWQYVMVQTSLNMAQNYRTTKEQHYFCRSQVTLNLWISSTRMHQYTITFPLQVCPHKPWDRNGKMVGRIKGCRHDNSCLFSLLVPSPFNNITQLWENIAKNTTYFSPVF